MPADLNIFKQLLLSLTKDGRITVWHMALVLGIIQSATDDNAQQPILISRKALMRHTHISSIATYHKCIKELQEFGYIDYIPSYHPGVRSQVFVLH
jgi:hypothetical protein